MNSMPMQSTSYPISNRGTVQRFMSMFMTLGVSHIHICSLMEGMRDPLLIQHGQKIAGSFINVINSIQSRWRSSQDNYRI